MDGLGRASAAPAHFKYKGRLARIKFTLRNIGEVENYLLSKRPDPIQRDAEMASLLGVKPTDTWSVLGRSRSDNFVSLGKVLEFIQTEEGMAFCIWINEIDSYEDALEEIKGWKDGEKAACLRAIMMAGGLDNMSAADWPPSSGGDGGRIDWRKMINSCVSNGMVEDVLSMNIYQYRAATASEKLLEGRIAISPDDPNPKETLENTRKWLRTKGDKNGSDQNPRAGNSS